MGDRNTGRGRGMTALVEGFFAVAWFSWGPAGRPHAVTNILTIGSVASIIVAILGAVLAARSPKISTPMADPAVRKRYGKVVGIEFGSLIVGAIIFGALEWNVYLPVLVCAGVGLHFFPLGRVLQSPLLAPLGGLFIAVAAAALVVGLTTDVEMSAVTGMGAGLLLLLFACLSLADVPRTTISASSPTNASR